jgi:hypothetical protein
MEAFVELLESEDWLTDETKAFAKQKVYLFIFLILYCVFRFMQ